MDKTRLENLIGKLRKELNVLANPENNFDFSNKEIIKKSQELDKLLDEYLNRKQNLQ